MFSSREAHGLIVGRLVYREEGARFVRVHAASARRKDYKPTARPIV